MKNAVQKLRILFIMGCIGIALGLILWGIGYDYGVVLLGFGIFFMGFWAFILVGNPELMDYGELRQGKNSVSKNINSNNIFKDSMNDDIENLKILIMRAEKYPEHFRLLLITPKTIIRVHNGVAGVYNHPNESAIIQNLLYGPSIRGSILDIFSKLELIIDELLMLKIIDPDFLTEKAEMVNDILRRNNFHSKIKLLRDYNIIDEQNNEIRNLLDKLRPVRNGFAHSWDYYEIKYDNIYLQDNFDNFKIDLEKVWLHIIELYKNEQKNIDIKSIMNKIRELNQ